MEADPAAGGRCGTPVKKIPAIPVVGTAVAATSASLGADVFLSFLDCVEHYNVGGSALSTQRRRTPSF